MEREEPSGDPSPGQAQSFQKKPKENGIASMQENVYNMVAPCLDPPKVMLGPKYREGDRIILRNGSGLKPDVAQALNACERLILADVGFVIPKKVSTKAGGIDQERGGHDQEG